MPASGIGITTEAYALERISKEASFAKLLNVNDAYLRYSLLRGARAVFPAVSFQAQVKS